MATGRTLYVGGLADEVTQDVLKAAFVPFGDVKDVHIPVDPGTCEWRLAASTALRAAWCNSCHLTLTHTHAPAIPHLPLHLASQ